MLLPVLASAALILSAPFMGLLRTWLGEVFQGSFVTFMAGAIGTAVAAVAIAGLVRIRTRRLARFATIGLALAIAAVYSSVMATGAAIVDIVERVHFIEYGVITFLFYRAWRPAADVSVIVLPILAGIVVGTLEEWFQWFIPNRVGELRDIALNLVAVVCGLMISVALTPPARVAVSLSPASPPAGGHRTGVRDRQRGVFRGSDPPGSRDPCRGLQLPFALDRRRARCTGGRSHRAMEDRSADYLAAAVARGSIHG